MDNYKLKDIIKKEIKFHTKEIERHKHLAEIRNSKNQKSKITKHFHKRFQTIKIAKLLGFEYCEQCGSLE